MKRINVNTFNSLKVKGGFVVDIRSPLDFRNGHIEGSINLPLKNFTNTIMGMDRKNKIIMIVSSFDDSDMYSAVNYAEQLGFTELFVSEYKQLTKPDEVKTEGQGRI